MPITVISMLEFAKETGAGEPLWDNEAGRYRFPNGSISDGEHYHRGPPDDPKELLDAKIEYVELQVRRTRSILKNESERYSMACQLWANGSGGPLPDENWRNDLRKLKSELEGFEKQLADMQLQRKPSLAESNLHWREKERRNAKAEANRAMSQLAAILSPNNESKYH